MDESWIVYDASRPTTTLDHFLALNKPSQVSPLTTAWIAVQAPSQMQHNVHPDVHPDVAGLISAWSRQEPRNPDTLYLLSLQHDVLSGKWLLFFTDPQRADDAWARVARAVVQGKLGPSAKIAPMGSVGTGTGSAVMCVYTANFADEADVRRVREELRTGLGFEGVLNYKSDAMTYLGIDAKNRAWKPHKVALYRY